MSYFVYLGCYTHLNNPASPMPSEGIYALHISEEGKLLSTPELLCAQKSPGYFYLTRDQRRLYALSDYGEEAKGGVYGYRVEPKSGRLTLFTYQEAPGKGLCHIMLDPPEKNLVAICYPEATVQVYPLNEEGEISPMFCLRRHVGSGPNKERQEEAHAHCAFFNPAGDRVYVCDLGMDTVFVYTVNPDTGKLHRAIGENIELPPGCGPRHLVFSPDGRFMYVACELSSQIMILKRGERGIYQLEEEVSTLSPDYGAQENYPSAIRLTKDGRFLYVSNRGEDTIACFLVHPDTGRITLQGAFSTMGWYPRDFILTRDERLLIAANQLSDDLSIYVRDEETGRLILTDHQSVPQKPIGLMELLLEGEE